MKKVIKKIKKIKRVSKEENQINKAFEEIRKLAINNFVIFGKNIIKTAKNQLKYEVEDNSYINKGYPFFITLTMDLSNIYNVEKENQSDVVDENKFINLFKYNFSKKYNEYKQDYNIKDCLNCIMKIDNNKVIFVIGIKEWKKNFDYKSFIADYIYLPIYNLSYMSLNNLTIN